jgi:acyl-CoA synthetase (AMP-forming)/AMP-acid ligase II
MALCLREGISTTFREHADKIAFHIEDTTVTYAGLDEKSARLASWLLKEHEEPYFAVLCDQSIDVAVAHVAALRAGKVLVALDPREPTKRTSALESNIISWRKIQFISADSSIHAKTIACLTVYRGS